MSCNGVNKNGKFCSRKVKNGLYCHQHSVKQRRFTQEKPPECIVCLEPFDEKSEPLLCGHWVHIQDIINSGKSACPICRYQLSFEPDIMLKITNRFLEMEQDRIEQEQRELRDEYEYDDGEEIFDFISHMLELQGLHPQDGIMHFHVYLDNNTTNN